MIFAKEFGQPHSINTNQKFMETNFPNHTSICCSTKVNTTLFLKITFHNSSLVSIECGWAKSCSKIMSFLFLKSFLLVMGSTFVFFRFSKNKNTNHIFQFSYGYQPLPPERPSFKMCLCTRTSKLLNRITHSTIAFFVKNIVNTGVKFKSCKKRCTLKCHFKCRKRFRRDEEIPYLMQKTQKMLKKHVIF